MLKALKAGLQALGSRELLFLIFIFALSHQNQVFLFIVTLIQVSFLFFHPVHTSFDQP